MNTVGDKLAHPPNPPILAQLSFQDSTRRQLCSQQRKPISIAPFEHCCGRYRCAVGSEAS
jgi:hypothetical protein